ncbi:hypothetical protein METBISCDRAFT_31825 [Metschnikowia bicuspidata]|uniref:MFS general substrate transporter n=1 Tax=Metschnikowia bicuspidata TaxID=27322 RepID=A0A4P9Z923_9ASCO|nr:hypothetical protein METBISCDRAFT_31825 [Metschnikowia bicuspidata]
MVKSIFIQKWDSSVSPEKRPRFSASTTEQDTRQVVKNITIDLLQSFDVESLVYSRTGYECYSAFDPDFECTAEEEKKLVRKLDWCVAFIACLMFIIPKALGPDRFVPMQIVSWSLVAICKGAVLWLSYFYTSKELPIRLSSFWTSLTQIFTSLLAFGILRMRGIEGLAGWRWLFILEGIITFLIGLWVFHAMAPSAVQTKSKPKPNGWFTDREEKIVVNGGDMYNRQALTFKQVAKSLADYDLWPIYLVGLMVYISMGTVAPYMTLTMKSMGFSTFNAVARILLLLIVTWFSERVNERSFVSLSLPLFTIPTMAALRFCHGWDGSTLAYMGFSNYFFICPYIHAICVAWAAYNMFNDNPLYKRGNMIPFWTNKWNAMTVEEQKYYMFNTKDEGHKRLDIRFYH